MIQTNRLGGESSLARFLSNNQLLIIYTCTILTLCTLYAVQPIQPLFEKEFSLSRFEAVIFTTVIMLPLGFAPIFYGYILETFSSKLFLRNAVLILGILELCFAWSDTYPVLLAIRALQGLLIPAVLTSLMSYISFITPKDRVQQAIGYYIGATILGGFVGRLLSGVLSDYFGWRLFFVLLGIALIAMFGCLNFLSEEVKVDFVKPKFSQIMDVLKNKTFFNIYMMMFFIFFVFQALLNFIPFQLKTFSSTMGYGKVGMMYAGYIIGFIISIRILWMIRLFKSESKTIIVGIITYVIGLQIFHINNYMVMFGGMFVFCAGFFIIHSVASGLISKLAHEKRAISNGLYLSFYYAGGTVGTFAPGVFYHYLGWHIFLGLLAFIVLGTLLFALRLQHSLH
ncbi:MFS transporter [Sulfurospirillum sp. UCH001]|uniref:MFS transporter n=1 Tax=Sulfurospirillum sp. UCH001 TaxID=1581011 RepID=UPI000AB85078|nr:MFS transporter [Sulfurospirillum sp. UCH001]